MLASGKGPAESLHDLVLASLQVASEQPDATTIYQNERPYLRERERFADVLADAADIQRTWLLVIEKGVAEGSFRADIAPRVFYRLIRDAVWLSVRWHHPAGDYPTSQLPRTSPPSSSTASPPAPGSGIKPRSARFTEIKRLRQTARNIRLARVRRIWRSSFGAYRTGCSGHRTGAARGTALQTCLKHVLSCGATVSTGALRDVFGTGAPWGRLEDAG